MTGTTIQIMQANRYLEMKYAGYFKALFNRQLHNYMNYLTGFDIVRFDRDIKVEDGLSLKDCIEKRYGTRATKLIKKLIGGAK